MFDVIGAALLAAGRPVGPHELSRLLGVPEEAVHRSIQELSSHLRQVGLAVEAVAGGYRLIVAPELVPALEPLMAPPPLPSLSQAALEVLAIVAYKQPITRADIELMLGSSASSLITLQERELIKEVGRKDVIGKPLLYGTTEKILLEFGLKDLSELPALELEGLTEFLRG